MDFYKQLKIIKKSRQIHAHWYREQYPDVAHLNIDPAEHYLRYGAAMGRNPGKGFDTIYYLETYPDAAKSGLNPLLHYLLHGERQGRRPRPPRRAGSARTEVEAIRTKLLGLGFTEKPLAELGERADATPPCPYAARELALWHMRSRTPQGYRTALHYVARARLTAPDLDFRSRLTTAELLCYHFLGQEDEGREAQAEAALRGEMSPDAMLAWVNFQPTPEARCRWINQVLRRFDIPPVALLPGEEAAPYDRLIAAESPPPVRAAGTPRVSVLLAAYAAATTLPTALRSLQEQTWRNLEIIVIDDASPDDGETVAIAEEFASRDPRIRVLRMAVNGGAYVARNRSLDAATGDYVTIHDADDWSHPAKIETQVRFMEANLDSFGCTSEQARALDDLRFTRVRGNGGFILVNTSSFLFRRRPMREALGYWDTVRFGADSELIRRARKVFGKNSIKKLATGPLSFQRESENCVTSDPITGVSSVYYGARKEYYDAQSYYHEKSECLRYDSDTKARPFPAPALMHPDRMRLLEGEAQFDVVIYGDFRHSGDSMKDLIREIKCFGERGKRVGLVETYDWNIFGGAACKMNNELRGIVDGDLVQVLVYGDVCSTDEIIETKSGARKTPSRFLPSVRLRDGETRTE